MFDLISDESFEYSMSESVELSFKYLNEAFEVKALALNDLKFSKDTLDPGLTSFF